MKENMWIEEARREAAQCWCDEETKDLEMTLAAWRAEGQRRFGEDEMRWKFVCPACGHVQAVEDFRRFKDTLGVNSDTARFSCIGRYAGARRGAFEGSGEGPCDYTSGGLFDIRPVVVVTPAGERIRSFAFAGSQNVESTHGTNVESTHPEEKQNET